MAWPVRGQKAPNYWDDEVKAYIDDADSLLATSADLDAHINDTAAAHAASAISYAGASGLVADDVEEALDELDAEKAPLASPVFTGTPSLPTGTTAVTQDPADNDTSVATTAFVHSVADDLVEDSITDGVVLSAPSQNAVFDALAGKADLASPAFTGNPTAPSPAPGDNDTSIATTEWVQDEIAGVVGGTPSASTVVFAPDGNIEAVNVQDAIVEVRDESVQDGDSAGGVLSGTYPNPGFAVDMATQGELDNHINDTTAAHTASAISYAGASGLVADDVEEALDELDAEKAPLDSPTFTGTVTLPSGTVATTQSSVDSDTSVATTAFVHAVADLKVDDEINNGTTDIAPSQNAVFDALGLKMGLQGVRFITTGETFDKDDWPNAKQFRITCVGPGGGGAGAPTAAASNCGDGGGGGAGGTAIAVCDPSELSSSGETVTIGTGGAGGSAGANNGSAGSGPTSFGSLCSAGAGSGGSSGAATAGNSLRGGGSGSIGTIGDILLQGGDGGNARIIGGVGVGQNFGGASTHGQSQNLGGTSGSAGVAGGQYGGGGSGARSDNSAAAAGGAGAAGVCIVEIFG